MKRLLWLGLMAVVVSPEIYAEGLLSFQNQFLNRGVPRNNGIGQFNSNDIKEIGFSNLVQIGNALFERNRFGGVSRLIINGAGNLIGATEPDTFKQLREFTLKNFGKLNGNQQLTSARFLARNGGFSDGILRNVNVMGGVLGNVLRDQKYGGLTQDVNGLAQLGTSALNFLMNSLSVSPAMVAVSTARALQGNGMISSMDLRQFFNQASLTILQNDNPYACTGQLRVDWLIARGLNPPTYRAILGFPDNLDQLAQISGVGSNFTDTVGNKTLMYSSDKNNPQSKPTPQGFEGDQKRVIERQVPARFGSYFYQSYDFNRELAPGSDQESRNPFRNPLRLPRDAGEIIGSLPNGFSYYALSNAQKQLVDEAPSGIALDGGNRLGTDRCFSCHASGMLGGGRVVGANFNYSDHYQTLINSAASRSTAEANAVARFYTSTSRYDAARRADSQGIIARLKGSNSFVANNPRRVEAGWGEAAPILSDISEEYKKPPTPQQMAAELGMPVSALPAAFQNPPGGTVPRSTFEQAFCSILAQGRRGLAGGGQIQPQPRAPQQPQQPQPVPPSLPGTPGAGVARTVHFDAN